MGSLSPMLIAGSAVLILGEILHIVGLATNNWVKHSKDIDANAGLWQVCSAGECDDLDKSEGFWDDYSTKVEAVRAMVILGMLCGLAGCVVAVVMLVFTITSKTVNSMMPIVCVASSIAAFIFIIIGVIIFAVGIYEDYDGYKEAYNLAFSFALCIVGGILIPVGGGLAYVGGGASV